LKTRARSQKVCSSRIRICNDEVATAVCSGPERYDENRLSGKEEFPPIVGHILVGGASSVRNGVVLFVVEKGVEDS
jgi:hypothetical protein